MFAVHVSALIQENSSKRTVCWVLQLVALKKSKLISQIAFQNVKSITSIEFFRYGRHLVIVGSQSLRTSLLLPSTIPRDIDLSISNYCILERLARARYNGELAHGKFSLADIAGDPIAFHNQK